MQVSELMSTAVQTVRPGTPAATVRERMRAKAFHHMVVMEKGELVGLVSARDLARVGRRGGAQPMRLVKEFMSSPVVTVSPSTSVHRAANSLRGHNVGCLVVVDGGSVVGIVTLTDMLKRVAEPARHRPDRSETRTLNHRVPHRKHQRGGMW